MAHLHAWKLVALLALVLVATVDGYDTGAPLSACSAMMPGHVGISPQTSTAPFTVTASQSSYNPGDTLTVTITATGIQPLAGFLLQARLASSSTDMAYGVFTSIANTQAISCSSKTGSALTHTDGLTNSFTTLAVQWTAPNSAPGDIKFRATLAIKKDTYWVGVESPVIKGPVVSATVSTEPATTTQATVQSSGTPGATTIDLSGCKISKGCLRSPADCEFTNCDAVLTWSDASTGYVNFEISRKGSGWVALGLSSDVRMGDDSVMQCMRDNTGKMMVSQSKNIGQDNRPISDPRDEGIDNVKVGYNNGIMVCSFRRQKLVKGRTTEIFDINTDYHLIIARGVSFKSGSDIGKHEMTPSITPKTQSFGQNSEISGTFIITPLIKAHGCIMIVAWVIMSAFGITMARHFKKQWPGEKLAGKDVWFPLHQIAMGSTFILTIIAFIIIFVEINGYSQITDKPSILSAHPVLGIIVTCLVIINPIMAVFRPTPHADNRPIFNWAHWGVGTLARILAVVTVFLGLSFPRIKVSYATNGVYIMIGYVCFYAICEIILEIHRCSNKTRENDGNDMELKAPGEPTTPSPVSSSSSGQFFRNLMLGVIILGLLGFGVILVVIIAIS